MKTTRSYSFLSCLLLIVGLCQSLFVNGAEKDSTRWDFRVKGLDFDIGIAVADISLRQHVDLLQAFTPAEEHGLFNYDQVMVSGYRKYEPIYVRTSIVLTNNHDRYRWFFNKRELLLGLGFESDNAISSRYSNIRNTQYPWVSPVSTYTKFTYQCQYITAAYQFASKPFLQYFALFSGLNARFGMNTYKQVEMTGAYYNSPGYDGAVLLQNYNIGYFSSGGHLGVKYNLSCDLNLFMRYETGFNTYGGAIRAWSRFSSFGIGLRYKIIDDQDRPKYDLMKYF